MYNKNEAALTSPMGWNSYDYYNTMVNEQQVRENAEYLAKNLKKFGWEYVVIDIQWSDEHAGDQNEDWVQYIPFSHFNLDEYGRQIPALNRFPSAVNGAGFKVLADYIHSLGLKFGIHIMRGIPRYAAANHIKIKTHDGSTITADQIANPHSVSKWNGDMYGVDYRKKGAQDYYDSIFELYAEWGVDFVKVDDICNTNMYPHDPYSAEKEIEMIAKAIENSGRSMVLSLSPGPAVIEKAWHLKKYANMWRITDDFWDDWKLLKAMFERCEVWESHTGNGNWPDCDMLPLGYLGWGWGHGKRVSNFTEDELRTMMTLWCIFRSPLMIGTDLPQLKKKDEALLTNQDILDMQKLPSQAKLVARDDKFVVWTNKGEKGTYLAVFNISDEKLEWNADSLTQAEKALIGNITENAVDLWTGKKADLSKSVKIPPHAPLALRF